MTARRITNAQVLAAFEAISARLSALESAPAPAPVAQAPAAPSAFVASLRERAAARVACAVHAGCTRHFSPKSSGALSHVACKGCADKGHHHPR